MKLRIKGDSIRIRLAKTEVEKLCKEGLLQEHTNFANGVFIYSLQKAGGEMIEASFSNNQLAVTIPAGLIEGWETNNLIGFNNRMANGIVPPLYILIEKDFKCIDNSTEDQADNYENPKNC